MNKIKPHEVIELCKKSNNFYKKGTILFIEKGELTYKIHNVSEISFNNLYKRLYGISI
ncbi:hypothetical protein [Cetobacterium sp.]|uniref:hypothetical protein n=1 Tax=Cetobacterium sp. TaxID=2071632 RepID=UPI003F317E75